MNVVTEETVIVAIKATELHRNYVTQFANVIEDTYKESTFHWSQEDLRLLVEMIHGRAKTEDVIAFFGRDSNTALSLGDFWNCVDPVGTLRASMFGCEQLLKNLVLLITDDAGNVMHSVPGNCLHF